VKTITDELGCVTGRVYQWMRKPENAWRIRQVPGKDVERGGSGKLYVLDETQHDPRVELPPTQRAKLNGRRISALPRIKVGDALELVAIESLDSDTGEITVVLLDAAGQKVRARVSRV
jgi:hypothetical protein